MNVIKIVVDELPECCGKCKFVKDNYYYSLSLNPTCTVSKGDYVIDNPDTRPPWCPLVVEECCEWKLVVTKYPYESVTEWDEDMVCQSCRFIVPCTVLEDHLGGIEECKYCPSCGKRIKYVESEEE